MIRNLARSNIMCCFHQNSQNAHRPGTPGRCHTCTLIKLLYKIAKEEIRNQLFRASPGWISWLMHRWGLLHDENDRIAPTQRYGAESN